MQRRAVAIYVTLFLVIGVGSYTLVTTGQQPSISFDDPEHSLSQGDTVTVNERTYTVSSLDASTSGGDHGSPVTVTREATFAWTNESARQTAELENGTVVPYQNDDYVVLTPDSENETTFTLREEMNRTAILQDDPDAENELATQDGEKYVVVTENGSRTLVEPSEYFPAPDTEAVAVGDQFDYEGNQTTIAAVGTESVTLEWFGPQQNTVSVTSESNVTLNGQQYVAFMPNNETLQLENDYTTYQNEIAAIDTYNKRTSGLWGVTILSGAAVIFLAMLAFLPSRY
jgi:sorbitol-specific phosphotransferase system component IIA